MAFGNLGRFESDASETITLSDGVAVLRAAAALHGDCRTVVCDVDRDGGVGVTDAVATLHAAAGLPSALT